MNLEKLLAALYPVRKIQSRPIMGSRDKPVRVNKSEQRLRGRQLKPILRRINVFNHFQRKKYLEMHYVGSLKVGKRMLCLIFALAHLEKVWIRRGQKIEAINQSHLVV